MHYQEQSECQDADDYFMDNLQNLLSGSSFQGSVYYTGGCQSESAGDALAGGTCYKQVVYQAISPTGYMCPGWYVEMYSPVPVSPEDCQVICSESSHCGATTFQEADQSVGRYYNYCARGTAHRSPSALP